MRFLFTAALISIASAISLTAPTLADIPPQNPNPSRTTFSRGTRGEIGGNHVDYLGGDVLAGTLKGMKTEVELLDIGGRKVEVFSPFVTSNQRCTYLLGEESSNPLQSWGKYYQAATATLAGEGYRVGGFKARITDSIPLGAGVSSSAALSVTALDLIDEIHGFGLTNLDKVRLAQKIEKHLGANVGALDPAAIIYNGPGEISLFNFSRGDLGPPEKIPFLQDYDIFVLHTGFTHNLADSAHGHGGTPWDGVGNYNLRRQEQAEVEKRIGKKMLDVTDEDLRKDFLRHGEDALHRRARFWVGELKRVPKMVEALKANDASAFGQVMWESLDACQRDFQNTTLPMDLMAERAQVLAASLAPSLHPEPRRRLGRYPDRRCPQRNGQGSRGRDPGGLYRRCARPPAARSRRPEDARAEGRRPVYAAEAGLRSRQPSSQVASAPWK